MESQGGAEAENGVGGGSSGGNSSASGSRWNPTKEQISMLENLYKQGIRTPSAEKIEQITARLRAYGQIEGKNVFYWFQNHKARQRQRQRQRQKQERTTNAYFNPFVNTSQYPAAFSSPLCQNVIYTPPYCLPQSDFGFYTQHPNAIVPGPISPRTENIVGPMTMMPRMCDGPPIYDLLQQKIPDYGFCNSNRKTLDLFPQHPTGTLEGETTDHVVSADCSIDTSSASSIVIDECGRSGNQPYFDFFTSRQESRLND